MTGRGQGGANAEDVFDRVKAALSSGRSDEAIDLARRHIAVNPKDPLGYIALGHALKKVHRYEDATMVLDQAVLTDPGIVMAWSLRGICKALVGDCEGALADSERALKLDPKDRRALALKDRIEMRIRLGGTPRRPPPPRPLDLVPEILPKPTGCVEPPSRPAPVPTTKAVGPPIQATGATETKYMAPELSQAIVDELEQDRDSILVLVPKINALKASIASLQALTEMYEMDGVVICADRPARFLRKAFSRCSRQVGLVHYIELMAGEDLGHAPPDADAGCPSFDLERLMKVIEEGVQHKADRHGGEDHFVMWDDASALRFYHEPKALQRFFEALSEHLAGMGVVHVVVMAREASSMVQRWPGSAFKASINVKDGWMSRSG